MLGAMIRVQEQILMLGDGNGHFTEATGLTMDGSGFGLGSKDLSDIQ